MIEIRELTKTFNKAVAVDNINLNITEGSIIGFVGSNGSGKSTLLRLFAGVYEPDNGIVLVNGKKLFDNHNAKGECFFIPDFPFFYNDSTIEKMAFLYRQLYPNWSEDAFDKFCSMFPVDKNARIINMSKGMQRQAALILALSTCPKYLFLDEIFDGLDPVVHQLLKQILIDHVAQDNMTVVIASHNLRELENFCDHVCLMHHGKMLMEREIDMLKLGLHKVQIAFSQVPDIPDLFADINVVNVLRNDNIFNVTIRGEEEDFMPKLNALNPEFVSAMPLTLEEIFIIEMEAAGYDINNIL